ncbi:hypothetical protein FNF29_02784 [Cafeteria roenbergensis]|uniref:PH domain-containing protein n=1 Tax=Cafeteria roenbergensis TaxID=33653 RepID=A0A5A8CNX6_CAFRO|nr:hypothetical protein FNF29_02784 [Cafeteria roenbergensis]|eukprot:KAA0154164.1 hypothetical protein FNF29_02784 [Cafeteria roenbergensis]
MRGRGLAAPATAFWLLLLAALESARTAPGLTPLEAPRLLDRALNHLTVGWSPPQRGSATVFNVLLNGESVYTGPRMFHAITGLAADKCYSVTVSAFVRIPDSGGSAGGQLQWTEPSAPLRASTRTRSAVSMRGLSTELAAARDDMERAALTPVQRGSCALGGFASAAYVGGGDSFVEFTGVSDEISSIGAQAAAVNCKLVSCQSRTRITLPPGGPMQGRLKVAVGSVASYHFVERTVRLHSTAPVLQFTDPRSPTQMASVPLRGCRARQGMRPPPAAGASSHGGNSAAVPDNPSSPCFRVECSSTVTEHMFCAGNAAQAHLWVQRVNEATHGLEKPDRWETLIKAAAFTDVVGNPRRPRIRGVFEQAASRDAWIASFLAALPRSGSCPHFPLAFGTTQCLALPDEFGATTRGPRSDMGLLPPRSAGWVSQQEFQAAVDEGRASDHSWLVSFSDLWQTSLATLLDSFRGPTLPEGFARMLMFQLIFAVGSARHAFGFHHNDLANLGNVKVYQVPTGSLERMEHWCYVTNPGAMAMLPLVFRDEAAAGKEGTLPGTRRRDRLFELIDGADACAREGAGKRSAGQRAASLLHTSASGQGASAATATLGHRARLTDEKANTSPAAEEGGSADARAWATSGGRATRYSETSGAAGGSPARARTSWCLPSSDMDGLRIVLRNFEVSSVTRVQLDWWKDGYAFPNTAWRDDLQDIASAVCGILRARSSSRSAGLADLCERMEAGVYAERPLMALQHPWFGGLPKVAEVHPSRRQTFIYTPLTIADIPDNASPASAATALGPVPGTKGGHSGTGQPSPSAAGQLALERQAQRRSAAAEASRRSSAGALAGLLALLTPPPPWVQYNDGTTLTLEWTAHKQIVRPLAPSMPAAPESFGLLQDRVSVYSGPSTTYALPAPVRGECHEFRVAAYYHVLGWTSQSEPLTIGDCSAVNVDPLAS